MGLQMANNLFRSQTRGDSQKDSMPLLLRDRDYATILSNYRLHVMLKLDNQPRKSGILLFEINCFIPAIVVASQTFPKFLIIYMYG